LQLLANVLRKNHCCKLMSQLLLAHVQDCNNHMHTAMWHQLTVDMHVAVCAHVGYISAVFPLAAPLGHDKTILNYKTPSLLHYMSC
jgi:hypothetical protein